MMNPSASPQTSTASYLLRSFVLRTFPRSIAPRQQQHNDTTTNQRDEWMDGMGDRDGDAMWVVVVAVVTGEGGGKLISWKWTHGRMDET
jgi:hypothetical protein